MLRRARWVLVWGAAAALLTVDAQGQDCAPCQEFEEHNLETAGRQLTEAFRLSLEVSDCSSVKNDDICREIDKLVEEVLETIYSVFNGHMEQTVAECLTCDPSPHLWPLVDGATALIALLREKGDEGFTDSRNTFVGNVEQWKRYRCPCTEGPVADEGPARKVKRNREAEAREEIIRKCSEKFANGRRGLLQVFRVPDDRKGCYQSRACRSPTVYKGYQTQSGFWTYDGEYWYVWEERRATEGKWITCEN